VHWEEEDVDAVEYIEDDQSREKEFKTRFTQILNVCKAVSVTADPVRGAEVLLLVATASGKMLSYATAKMQPMISTEQGKKLITALMSASSVPSPLPNKEG